MAGNISIAATSCDYTPNIGNSRNRVAAVSPRAVNVISSDTRARQDFSFAMVTKVKLRTGIGQACLPDRQGLSGLFEPDMECAIGGE